MAKDLLISSFKPAHQLVVYNGPENRSYVEHYEIINYGGKQHLSQGTALKKKVLKKMIDLVMSRDRSVVATIHQLLPKNVLYYDPRPGREKIIWFNKAQERILFGIHKKRAAKAKLPAFLYVVDDESLYIYALKTSRRPDVKTPLFHAPLPNVYETGSVCMGDVKKPKNHTELADFIKGWEVAFWGSKFARHLWDNAQDKALRTCIRNNRALPLKSLKPTRKTVNSLIK